MAPMPSKGLGNPLKAINKKFQWPYFQNSYHGDLEEKNWLPVLKAKENQARRRNYISLE
jgi:hypothetical protein